jgi:hypothetical protein
MRRNAQWGSGEESVASVRAGQGLLAGVLRCGRCGRRLHVRYWGKSGTSARYLCKGAFDAGGKKHCLGFGGRAVDERIAQELLRVLAPLGVRASLAAVERLSSSDDERREPLRTQLQQLRYEAQRAYEQYDEVDPRNRLVAAQLEERWNKKLEQVEKVAADLASIETPTLLKEHEQDAILALAERFEDVGGLSQTEGLVTG